MTRSHFTFWGLEALLLGAVVLGLATCVPCATAADKPTVKNGTDDGLGYTAAFDAELKKLGPITPKEFADRYTSKAKYIDKLTWDPTTAKFYDLFNKDPRQANPNLPRGVLNDDFRLNEAELAAFKKNGFVVSERMGTASFAEMYYRIFSRDLPVYVSADAVLHAWHRTYDSMLMEVELAALAPALARVLEGMAEAVPAVNKDYGKGVLADGVSDADYFLAVARSLLAGRQITSHLGQDNRVAETLKACDSLQLMEFKLFGRDRKTDFSQFKPRGHYERSEDLQRYFRAMMWCGRIDLRVAGHPDEASPREMAGAVVLGDLLKRSSQFGTWEQFDKVLQTFVGRTDSMTFAQLNGALAEAKIKSPADVKDLDTLSAIQEKILDGTIGLQHIRGDVYVSPFGSEKVRLPRSFTVLGQKFVLDSWALSKVVYDDIIWEGDKVQRRVPSGLDAAFAALGNDAAVPGLTGRMTDRDGRKFRDGLNYQHNLAAVRNVIDSQRPEAWDENLYMNWLATLRELSKPTTDARYPEAMRNQAWAMKSLNTQLASWTQLRHDTVLYVKQSYTAVPSCVYPAGYVEPVPHFWARLEKMASRAAELIEKTSYPDRSYVPTENRMGPTGRIERKGEKVTYRGKDTQDQQAKFLRNFAKQVGIIRGIAEKELAEKELSADEAKFLKEVVQTVRQGSGSTRYGGWYPGLFYQDRTDSGTWDAICADVHTDPPADLIGDPGCVLHQGVGNVDFLLLAVDSGKDRMVYAGPVLSHYEFEMAGVNRKADSEWRKGIKDGKLPPRPEWTRDYLVPGENPEVKSYWHGDDRP
jgi:Protein of unknown function (DUF3160)